MPPPSDVTVPDRFGPEDVADDPMEQWARWWDDAIRAGEREPEAVCVSTVGAEGVPSSRFVLLRGAGPEGFTFFTNRTSRKGGELAANAAVAMAWRWPVLDRQVRVTGTARTAADEVSDAYFGSRARRSQLGAWASHQSAVLPDRAALDDAVAEADRRFAGGDVPRPAWWGGYLVVADTVEYWQGRPNRLHDRVRYRRQGPGWERDRLSP